MAAHIKTTRGHHFEIRSQKLNYLGNPKEAHLIQIPIELTLLMFQWFKLEYPVALYQPPWKRDNLMAEAFAEEIQAELIITAVDPFEKLNRKQNRVA